MRYFHIDKTLAALFLLVLLSMTCVAQQAASQGRSVEFSVSLEREPCLGDPLVFLLKLTNVGDKDVTVYPEYLGRDQYLRAYDGGLTKLKWKTVRRIYGLTREAVLAPGRSYSEPFLIDTDTTESFFRNPGKYGVGFGYTPSDNGRVPTVDSNEVIFQLKRCAE